MEWRTVPSFPAYEVSEHGQLRRRGRILRGSVDAATGYLKYSIRRDGRHHKRNAHQLVIEAFVGPKPFDGAVTRHKDGLRINDHWTNLEWGTQSANAHDRVRDGRGNHSQVRNAKGKFHNAFRV